jgi:hypothetical protein
VTVSRSLSLPNGYQHFDWNFDKSVVLNDPDALRLEMNELPGPLQLYTQHEIFLENDTIKHTRSSPNWDGGLATFATCKHLMRSYAYDWKGTWLVGLCPAFLSSNTILFAGRIDEVFDSNYDLSRRVMDIGGLIYDAKNAMINPRGDLYEPKTKLSGEERFNHERYEPPPNHTRSLEYYEKSPGSKYGAVPKWWRDVEYMMHGRRPKVFILRPFHVFSKPSVWTSIIPGRATRRLSTTEFISSVRYTERGVI